MLQQMRALSKSWVSTVLMGGLALSFALWGIGDIFRGQTSTAIATVGGAEIDQSEFKRDYQNTVAYVGRQKGGTLSQEDARKMNLPHITLEKLTSDRALENLASKMGLTVGDDTVTQEIQNAPLFKGINGTFDHQVFLQQVNRLGYTEQGFIELMRSDLARAQLSAAGTDGFVIPAGYLTALAKYVSEARAVDYVVVTPEMIPAIPAPTEKQLTGYVNANPARFSTPEYRSVTYASIGPEDVADKITVTDKQLHDAYDEAKATYVVPEKRDADQISFPTQAEAAAAKAKLDAKTLTYDALAKSRNLTAQTMSLGSVAKEQLTGKAEADALFALPENGISDPVKGPFGYVLLRVRKITPAVNKSFDDVKADLTKQLKTQLAAASLVDLVNKFTDAQGSGDDIAQAAKAAGMHVTTVPAVDQQGLPPGGTKGVISSPELIRAIFAADVGADGDVFQTPDGHYYALKVNGVTPPKVQAVSAVHDVAVTAWTHAERAKALAQKANELAAQANKDGKLSGGAIQSSGRLNRTTVNQVFSRALIDTVFSKPAGVAVVGPIARGEGYIVARTTAVSHPKFAPNDPNIRNFGQQLSQQIVSDLNDAFGNAEKICQGVKVNQKLFEAAIGNGNADAS
jgi:peptidyl-prolyl cis-trans isomerase D